MKVVFTLFGFLIINGVVAQSGSCLNTDFEQSSSSAGINSASQISGWVFSSGSHTNLTGSNSCNLFGCCGLAPAEASVIVAPSGYTDPAIGSCYPIFSVFGTTAGNAAANNVNPQISGTMKGNAFIMLNSPSANASITRATKTISVSTANALFTFAYIAVLSATHSCCDAAAFQINLENQSTGNPIACPGYSAAAYNASCTVNLTGQAYYAGTQCNLSTSSSAITYNKWKIIAFDLSPYIGQVISVNVVASDCSFGDHAGYVYFDAQCSPFEITCNNQNYSAATPTIAINNCIAPICAPEGLGPYYWKGTGIASAYTQASYSNQCMLPTSSTANYTLTMLGIGSCVPINRSVNFTPKSTAVLSAPSGSVDLCFSNTVALAPMVSGNSQNPMFLWSGPSTATMIGSTTPTVVTNAPGVYTCMASDPTSSCVSTAQFSVGVCIGINELAADAAKVNVYPNPARGLITVNLNADTESELQLYDVTGALCASRQLRQGDNSVDISDLASGIYLVKVMADRKLIYRSKLVKAVE